MASRFAIPVNPFVRPGWSESLLTFGLSLLLSSDVLAVESPSYRVQVEEARIPALSSASPDFIDAWQVVASPDDGFLVIESGLGSVHRLRDKRAPQLLISPDQAKRGFVRPFQNAADNRHILTIDIRNHIIQVSDAELRPVASFTTLVFNAALGVELAGDKLFGMGTGIVVAEEPITDEELSSLAWRRRHWREECGIFRISWRQKTRQPDRMVCDSDLANLNIKTMSVGDLLHHGGKVFAVAAAAPWLYILDVDDEANSDKKEWYRKVSLLASGESFVSLTPNQVEAEKADAPGAYWANRDRFPWFQGLVRAGDGIGVVYRVRRGEESRFVIDVYSAEGERLANDLPIPLPRYGLFTRAFFPVNLPNGGDFLLVKGTTEKSAKPSQQLYRIKIVAEPDGSTNTSVEPGR